MLKVAIESQPGSNTIHIVKYYKNDTAVYTSTGNIQLSDYPLIFDTSIASSGGQIFNAFIAGDTVVNCSSPGWCQGYSVPNNTGSNVLNTVAVIAPNNIWAVGGYNVTTSGSVQSGYPLIENWDGASWNRIPDANVPQGAGILRGISAVNATHIWDVGDNLVLKYSGSPPAWSQVPALNSGGNGINARPASGTTELWVVGNPLNRRRNILGNNHSRNYRNVLWSDRYCR